MDASSLSALASKAGLIWVTPADGSPRPLWFSWHDDAIHLVVGGGEQPDPFERLPCQVEVRVPSKETGASVLQLVMTATALAPGTAAWVAAAAALSTARLNAGEPDLPEVWATTAHIVRLEPQGAFGAASPETSLARPVSVDPVRPRGWRRMRAHLRR